MARTLAQVNAEIERLQREAGTIRTKEVAGVVGRIKEAIAYYGLTPGDLFGTATSGAARKAASKQPSSTAVRKATAKKSVGVVRYKDESGNTWTGHGKRPKWFIDALAAGRTPQELEVSKG